MGNSNRIFVDTSFALKEGTIDKYEEEVLRIQKLISSKNAIGHQNLGFLNVYANTVNKEINNIRKIKDWLIAENIEFLVTIAPQHICLQAESLIEYLYGRAYYSSNHPVKVIFVNECINSREIAHLAKFLETKNFAINVISHSGESIETLLIFRELKAILHKLLGKATAKKYIFITTNNNYGKLFNEARVNNYRQFVLLDNSTEKFLNYSAAILFPLACAGIDIEKYLSGALMANNYYAKTPLKKNPAYQYAVSRYILSKNNFNLENLNVFSAANFKLAKLYQMYLGETTLKANGGIYVVSNLQPADNKSFSENNTASPFKMFDTTIIIETPRIDYKISAFEDDDEGLNSYAKLTYNTIEKTAIKTMIENHVLTYKIPNIKITITDDSNEETLGWIIAFIHHASIMSAYLRDVNPFINQGVESYNTNLLKNLTELIGGNND